MFEKPKLLVIGTRGGCDYWRTYLPCEEMRKQGLAEVQYVDARQHGVMVDQKKIGEKLYWADLVILRGLVGTDGLATLKRYLDLGIKVVSDYDDLHFNVSPWNPAYKQFGTDEVEVTDPTTGHTKFLWKDGEEGFDLKRNKITFHAYKQILQSLPLLTTTTLYLKQALAEVAETNGENIRVLPNAIDLNQWKPLDVRDKYDDKFRFGWAVSNSHAEDWLYFRPILLEFLKSHPDAKFVCIGDTSMDILKVLPKEQVEWHPFSDLWEGHYPMRMAMLGLDCAIAPLAEIEFNKCKSPLKWEEYTAFGWPVVAQAMTPYIEHIQHGKTGLLAGSKEAWLNSLHKLYEDRNYGKQLRFNALLEVKEVFDLSKVAHEWCETYKNLINGEINVVH